MIPANDNNGEMIMAYLRNFGEDIGKELGKQFGVEVSSKKCEKTKKKLQMEKNKGHCLMVALMMSWILFSVVYKLM